MAKINITKPTGSEALTLLSAFSTNNQKYIIFDSEKVGSMGLPIIYISKYTTKLEKIMDQNEWQSVKNDLKGILNGAKVEYIKVEENLTSDETFYTPLTLPAASFDTLKNTYVVVEDSGNQEELIVESPVQVEATNNGPIMPENIEASTLVSESPMSDLPNIGATEQTMVPPIIPSLEPINSNVSVDVNPPVMNPSEVISPVTPSISATSNLSEINTPIIPSTIPKEEREVSDFASTINFEADKEMFLKACENMFDALISKYQKELSDLELKKQELMKKEATVNQQVQVPHQETNTPGQIMDLNSIMPHNETSNNPAGVI